MQQQTGRTVTSNNTRLLYHTLTCQKHFLLMHKDEAASLSPAPKNCCVFFTCEPSRAGLGSKTISQHLCITRRAAAGRIWVCLWTQGPDEYCLSVSLISVPRGTAVMTLLRRVPEHPIALTCVRMDYSDCFAPF